MAAEGKGEAAGPAGGREQRAGTGREAGPGRDRGQGQRGDSGEGDEGVQGTSHPLPSPLLSRPVPSRLAAPAPQQACGVRELLLGTLL